MGPKPPGPCSRCNQMGHWAKSCPNPQPPTKPCPTCKQWGQWKMDCPWAQPTKSQGPPQAQQPWAGNQTQGGPGTPDHGSSDRREMIQLCLSYSSDRAQALDPKSDIQMDSVLRVIGTVARHKESLIPKRHWSGLFIFNLLSGPSPAFRNGHRRGLRHHF